VVQEALALMAAGTAKPSCSWPLRG
jgi:hypothetical protein